MITFMPESGGKIIGIRAGGKLTRADYRDILIPRLEALIARHGKIRALFWMDESFDGWEMEAALDNTAMDVKHRGDFEKVAMVGGPAWERLCAKLAGVLISGEIKTFPSGRLSEAWGWLRA